eukprot:scaffold10256_cov31-Tisochrysis_lutea.AAC.4
MASCRKASGRRRVSPRRARGEKTKDFIRKDFSFIHKLLSSKSKQWAVVPRGEFAATARQGGEGSCM